MGVGQKDLAGERTEEVWVLQASVAGAAKVAGAPEVPCLRPLMQENHFRTVGCVRLYTEKVRLAKNNQEKMGMQNKLKQECSSILKFVNFFYSFKTFFPEA